MQNFAGASTKDDDDDDDDDDDEFFQFIVAEQAMTSWIPDTSNTKLL